MKKVFLTLAAAALALVACNKNVTSDVTGTEFEGATGKVRVQIALEEPETKGVTTPANELIIKTLQVFVFNHASGAREADRFETLATPASTTTTLTLTTLTGEKDIYAIANNPRLSGVTNKTDLLNKISYLADNATDALTMVGHIDDVTVTEIDANSGSGSATPAPISISRLCSRVTLAQVTVDFRSTGLEGAKFQITEMYLKNCVNQIRIDGASTGTGMDLTDASQWSNKISHANVVAESAALKALTYDDKSGGPIGDISSVNTNNTATAVGYSWYTYPNTCVKANDQTGASGFPRSTRLVIKAHLSGTATEGTLNEDTFYVVSIPVAMVSNHIYNITNILIKGRGKPNDDDDSLTTSGSVAATVTVAGWGGSTDLSFTI